jgi:NAD(P) transhydrogenase subunit beta
MECFTNLSYIVASALFIIGIKMLGRRESARRGNVLSSCAMLLAVLATLIDRRIISYGLIVGGLITGAAIGALCVRRIKMTAMPEMVALLNGFGGLASLLVGIAEYYFSPGQVAVHRSLAVICAVFIGGVTFSGSMVAYLKLAGRIASRARVFPGHNALNGLILALSAAGTCAAIFGFRADFAVFAVASLALLLGITGLIPIGGGDMPVVISTLNSFSGLAASAAGFIIANSVLVVAGCLVGTSGLILTVIMCKAMNRSLANILFSGYGGQKRAENVHYAEPVAISVDDAYFILEAARDVAIIPGYGMAVAQAQHAVKELSQILEDNGATVRFAIHPVAGRMPGHMNVLLAEANVDYDKLVDMDTINGTIQNADVAIVIGANDVVNTSAADEPGSPIYGMPLVNAHLARSVIVLKRGDGAGFSGLQNKLFSLPNVRMLYGDARQTLSGLIASFKE